MIKDIKKTYDSYQNSMINKVNKFQQSVIKNNKFNDLYELNNLLIHRQLLRKKDGCTADDGGLFYFKT